MADCDRWQEAISAYADGEGSPNERKVVEAHLKDCPACREWLERVAADRERFTEELMRRQGDVSVGVGRELARERARKVPWWAHAHGHTPRWRRAEAFALAALCMVFVVVALPTVMTVIDMYGLVGQASSGEFAVSAHAGLAQLPPAEEVQFAPESEPPTASEPARETAALRRVTSMRAQAGVSEKLAQSEADRRLDELAAKESARTGVPKSVLKADMLNRLDDLEDTVDDFPHRIQTRDGWVKQRVSQPSERVAEAPEARDAAVHAGTALEQLAGDRVTEAAKPLSGGGTLSVRLSSPTLNYGIPRPLQLAYDAGCEVWVKKLQEAVVAAERVFYDRGGFVLVSSLDQAKTGKDTRRAEVTGKVPTAEAANTINALAALGYVARRDVQGQDLTDQYVTATRDITQTEEKISKLIEKRKNASRSEREWIDAQIADLRKHLGSAQDRTFGVKRELALSTIQATLIEKSPEPPPAAKGVQSAWRSFVHAAQTLGVWLIWVALYGLFGLPVLVGWLIYRRRKRGGGAAV